MRKTSWGQSRQGSPVRGGPGTSHLCPPMPGSTEQWSPGDIVGGGKGACPPTSRRPLVHPALPKGQGLSLVIGPHIAPVCRAAAPTPQTGRVRP